MLEEIKYPKILVLAMGRINQEDTSNNGLLLRNLFAGFPKENLAQIYSGGNNSDQGFFSRYYCLDEKDRFFGKIFFKLKSKATSVVIENLPKVEAPTNNSGVKAIINSLGKKILMDSGLYELIFRPKISQEMHDFINAFKPDYIFAQGYYLSFTWLPVMVNKRFDIPIIYYPTDDWSESRYRVEEGHTSPIAYLMRFIVRKSAINLVAKSKIRLAFNYQMKMAFEKRFGKEFGVIMLGDFRSRFLNAIPKRNASQDKILIACAGDFDNHRLPLLYDLDEACKLLEGQGIHVEVNVFPVNNIDAFKFEFIRIFDCPNHDDLISYFKGADILFLPERFDETVTFIRYSISSKSHLFMYSQKPILVYSHYETGIANYAKTDNWALVVDERNISLLADSIKKLVLDKEFSNGLISNAIGIAEKNHSNEINQKKFLDNINGK